MPKADNINIPNVCNNNSASIIPEDKKNDLLTLFIFNTTSQCDYINNFYKKNITPFRLLIDIINGQIMGKLKGCGQQKQKKNFNKYSNHNKYLSSPVRVEGLATVLLPVEGFSSNCSSSVEKGE